MAHSFTDQSTSNDDAVQVLAAPSSYADPTHFFIANTGSNALLFNIGDGVWRYVPGNFSRVIDQVNVGSVQVKNAVAGSNISGVYGDRW